MARKPNNKSLTQDTPTLESPIREAVRKTIQSICERFGKGAIMALGGDPNDLPRYEAVPTGSLGLDEALGIGGLPLGRIVEIYGPESSGKTTLTLHLIAEAQRRGLVCAFVDAEHALDVQYARALGVELDELLVSQPDHGEQALDIVDSLARTGAVGLIVIDSVAALIPKAELEGDMGDQLVGRSGSKTRTGGHACPFRAIPLSGRCDAGAAIRHAARTAGPPRVGMGRLRRGQRRGHRRDVLDTGRGRAASR